VSHPWDTGDLERNWQGYFIPGTSTLRNRVGALTLDALRDAENDLVEARVIELREAPDVLGDRSYDLAYLRAIHGQLFQDVYVWAGDVRTVGIEKGDESFCPPGSISQAMDHVAAEIHHLEQLKLFPSQVSRVPSRTCTTTRTSPTPSVRAMAAQLASSLTSSCPSVAPDLTGRRPI
jgi:cell filamentation protein